MEACVMNSDDRRPTTDGRTTNDERTDGRADNSAITGNPNAQDAAAVIDKNPYTYHDNDPSTLDSGAPIPVAVDYVEAQLAELWRDVAEAAQAKGGSQSVTTAQVLNLIVRAKSYEAAN